MIIYNNPKYYELAFSFIDVKKQTKFFEKLFQIQSKIKVKRILDLACGTSLQLREFAKKGYTCFGLDLNAHMLDYLQEQAEKEGIIIHTMHANMCDFQLKEKIDFAMIMMGSLAYMKSNKEFLQHITTMGKTMNSGGIYFIVNYRIK